MDIPLGGRPELVDEVVDRRVVDRSTAYEGMVWDVQRDVVDLGDAGQVTREYVEHPGAVVVVALREVDGVDHVVLIRQYRHPVRTIEWELPAGLLDEPGRRRGSPPPASCARRSTSSLGGGTSCSTSTRHRVGSRSRCGSSSPAT